MLSFCQRNPKWGNLKLGSSVLTMARYGCTTTAISDLSTYFKPTMIITPDKMCQYLKYTSGGLIIWESCQFTNFKFEKRIYGRNDLLIKECLKDPNRAIILEVDNSHWVVSTGVNLFGGYKIADPWFGDFATTKRYKQITGSAVFTTKQKAPN